MTNQHVAEIDSEKLKTKELHDLMLVTPVKDGFCRFYGSYVAVGQKGQFADGTTHTCIGTDTWDDEE